MDNRIAAMMGGNGRNGGDRRNIGKQIARQESQVLRKGKLDRWGFNQVRQRHMWSVFHFTSSTTTATPIVCAVGGTPILQAGDYGLFVAIEGTNGQGLPSGLQMTGSDTNFPGAGRVPDDQNFAVWEVGVTIQPERADVVATSPATMAEGEPHYEDVDAILEGTILSIKWLTNEVPLGPCASFPQAGGLAFAGDSRLNYAGGVVAGPPLAGGLGEGTTIAPTWDSRIARAVANSGPYPASPQLRRKLDVPIFLKNTQTFKWTLRVPRPIILRSVQNGGTGTFSARIDWWAVESFREPG